MGRLAGSAFLSRRHFRRKGRRLENGQRNVICSPLGFSMWPAVRCRETSHRPPAIRLDERRSPKPPGPALDRLYGGPTTVINFTKAQRFTESLTSIEAY